jgi:predicted nucleotidyltransferase
MQPIIDQNREKIVELCRQHYVQRLSVFGSAVRDDFDPARSDVDFLVDFCVAPDVRFARNYFDLQHSLAALLGREVDLVISYTVENPFLRRNIEAEQELLYAA